MTRKGLLRSRFDFYGLFSLIAVVSSPRFPLPVALLHTGNNREAIAPL